MGFRLDLFEEVSDTLLFRWLQNRHGAHRLRMQDDLTVALGGFREVERPSRPAVSSGVLHLCGMDPAVPIEHIGRNIRLQRQCPSAITEGSLHDRQQFQWVAGRGAVAIVGQD